MNANTKTVVGMFVLPMGLILAGYMLRDRNQVSDVNPPSSLLEPVACTMDAKICPDGSAVGRVGPRCEFAPCPPASIPTTLSTPSSWHSTTTHGIVFSYPASLRLTYVSAVDWPPIVYLHTTSVFTCLEAGAIKDSAGKTERVKVNGREYCLTREAEGAAGSVYTQYAYTFPRGSHAATMMFSTRTVQCLNYDEPRRVACMHELTAFDPNQLMDQIAQTVRGN